MSWKGHSERTEPVQQQVKTRVNDIAAGFAHAFGAQIDVIWHAGPTALVNDDRWADIATAVAKQSGYTTHHADLHMGGEDFAVYLQNTPAHLSVLAAPVNTDYITRDLIRTSV